MTLVGGSGHGGHTMAGALLRVLVCSPRDAGWGETGGADDWRGLGYHHAPRLAEAASQHASLVRELDEAGAEVLFLPGADGGAAPGLTLDAVYAHDASFPTDFGMISMSMGKPARRGEPAAQERFFRERGIPLLGAIEPPGLMEGGDLVWLDRGTILAGEGYRTNAEGIAQLRRLLAPHGIEVLAAPLPYGPGPAECLHLMSLLSVVDERCALVDLPWLAVSTVRELERLGFELVPIVEAERGGLACNVLALGGRRLLALAENEKTNERLRGAGFDVRVFPGSEISANGSGGPTCLTRPLLRES